ncbi:hypothetical protein SJDPG11_02085 [Porphyromonas gingivalis SJD11]|nr:hypothetical protein SJDPG11_02085 [Porphyromonas gingivalis SJD11]
MFLGMCFDCFSAHEKKKWSASPFLFALFHFPQDTIGNRAFGSDGFDREINHLGFV